MSSRSSSASSSGSSVDHDEILAALDHEEWRREKQKAEMIRKQSSSREDSRSSIPDSRESIRSLSIPDDPRDKDKQFMIKTAPFMRRLASLVLCGANDKDCQRRSSDTYIPDTMGSVTSDDLAEGALMRSTKRVRRKTGTKRMRRMRRKSGTRRK